MTAIVLTGTIVPQSNFVQVSDWKVRRNEYLECLKYYSKFGQVFFLENSTYDISADPDFQIENVSVIKYVDGGEESYRLGKGYQEFKMIDGFVDSSDCPSAFFKLTGRRYIENFEKFLICYDSNEGARFDILKKRKMTDTSFFFCSKSFYKSHISGAYLDVNDEQGDWIERVLYKRFLGLGDIRPHQYQPLFIGQSGSSGGDLKYPLWKCVIRNIQRQVWLWLGITAI